MMSSLVRALLSRVGLFLIGVALLLAVAAGIAADYWYGLPEDATATYVGRQSCIECHQQEAKLWAGSHHDLAMDLATKETVLASFDDQELKHHGQASRMFQRGGKYFVHTDGPDGKLADFEVKYVFGVTPLQQYMVEFDRPADMPEEEISRVQVLRETWDTKQKKWFYQNPPDVQEKLEPDDELHWTGVTQRWNTSCADCHSTNLKRNFDLDSRTYHTTFSEMDVSCESCHGPGSLHVQLAKGKSLFWDRKRGYALAKLKGESNLAQVEACAPCHSVRSPIHGGYAAGERLHGFYATELLRDQVYHPDGQILGEDYEYGSFTQSKMFHKNIRCSDCHNPHSLQLKHEGNQLCTSCHVAHPAGKFDSPAHHNHKVGSKGAQCVECHMPATTYMDVDPRRDHSLRIPRPDLSIKLGTPNACVACHISDSKLPENQRPKSPSPNRPAEYADWLREASQGKTAVKAEIDRLNHWADAAAEKWYGEKRKKEPHFAETLLLARKMRPEARPKLIDLLGNKTQPAIARATAAMELGMFVDPQPGYSADVIRALREALQDKSPESYRLAYLDEAPVNWCPALGTVLANEEVTADGRSERGNHPVYRRPLKQWMLRITAYADRLLADLDLLDWPESIKLMQRNWIGRSGGAEVAFPVEEHDRRRHRRVHDRVPTRCSAPRTWCSRPSTRWSTHIVPERVAASDSPCRRGAASSALDEFPAEAVRVVPRVRGAEVGARAPGRGQGEDRRVHRRRSP